MEYDKERYKEILLKTFQAFDELCKKHELVYYTAYGSLIGAIRHKGIIPWDDDIDVHMPIDSYDKFLSLKGKLDIPYRIDDMRDKGYFKPFAKFCDANTSIIEDNDIPYVFGVFIDVFPLYKGSKNDCDRLLANFRKYSWLYEISSRKIFAKQFISAYRNGGIKALLGRLKYLLLYKPLKGYFRWRWSKIERKCRECDGDCNIAYYGFAKNPCFSKDVFCKSIPMPFESMECMVPIGYDEYLRQIYGDYMKLPPIEEQNSGGHPKYYIDLDCYRNLKEIETILEN